MVSPGEWGPGAWELLHGIAERIGQHSNIHLIRDERNELKQTLRNFGFLLPCLKCQAHYKEWLKTHSPDAWIDSPFGVDLQESMRSWVFQLHENVNRDREIVSGIELESLSEKYKCVNLREKASDLKGFYQRGILMRTLKADTWKVAWKHLDLLLRVIS